MASTQRVELSTRDMEGHYAAFDIAELAPADSVQDLFSEFSERMVHAGVDPVEVLRDIINTSYRSSATPSNRRTALVEALGTDGEEEARRDLVEYAQGYKFGQPRTRSSGGPTKKAQAEFGQAVNQYLQENGKFPTGKVLEEIAARFGIEV